MRVDQRSREAAIHASDLAFRRPHGRREYLRSEHYNLIGPRQEVWQHVVVLGDEEREHAELEYDDDDSAEDGEERRHERASRKIAPAPRVLLPAGR